VTSAKTCSTTAWSRCCPSAWTRSNGESVNTACQRQPGAYVGAAPITRASGKTKSVTRRKVKNNRLAAVGYIWAFSALTASPGARAHYDRRRDDGDRHAAAQRNLFGRLLGCLHRCLTTGPALRRKRRLPHRPGKTSPRSLTT
jgi:hypothetical protein